MKDGFRLTRIDMSLKREFLEGKLWPPGGWAFYQPETNWNAPAPLQHNFDQQVKNIQTMRMNNPAKSLSTDLPNCAADLEMFTEARLRKTYRDMGKFLLQGTVKPSEVKKNSSSFTPIAKKAVNAAAGLVGIDSAVLTDWLGSGGKPVAAEVAIARAAVCQPCPANSKGDWRALVTGPAADVVKRYLATKHRMNLSTPADADLKVCQACKCHTELKVWVPMEYVKENQSPEIKEKLEKANPECWALK